MTPDKLIQNISMGSSYEQIYEFGRAKHKWIKKFLNFRTGSPGSVVRSHWGIENSLYWVLDVFFREDESRIRKGKAPENFAVLRHIALNMIKKEKSSKKSTKSKRLRAGWDTEYLLKVLVS